MEYIKNNFRHYIHDYVSISRKIIADKETVKDSSKYSILRNLTRECFERIAKEDIDYVLQEHFDDLYLLAVSLDVYINSMNHSLVVRISSYRSING